MQDETVEERRARGQELRKAVPRGAHAGWTPPPDRADPLDILRAQETGRLSALLPIRHARMATDAFAFLRGAAAIMAADLDRLPRSGLRVVASGDAHLGNFGAMAAPRGRPGFRRQ